MALDQAIISQAVVAATKEKGIKLLRSAYSPIVREANDCSTALLDVEGRIGKITGRSALMRSSGVVGEV